MRPRKYPWEVWFSRSETVIRRGEDYAVSQSTMGATIRVNASQRGVRVRLTDTGDGFIIKVVKTSWYDRGSSDEVQHPAAAPVVE